jgi:subtilase family serine protease
VNNSLTISLYVHKRACRGNMIPRAIRDLRRALGRFRRAATLASVLVLALPLAASAQNSAVPARVTDRVDVSQLATLSGNTHPLARAQYDQGAAPPDLPMDRIMLVLKRSAAQEATLQDLLVQQQVTSSPNFHKWVTPDQFGQQFGPADGDIQAVTSWLASFGFQSIKVSKGRTVIEFSGSASQVQTALHTPIHKYMVNGEAHWANANDPQIPAALVPVISGFVSLHNFQKKPASVRSGRTAALTRTSDGRPQITFSDGSHGLAPADFNTIYNVAPTMTGGGVTPVIIGVVARSNINVADVHQFRSQFGLPANDPIVIPNGPDPGNLLGGEEAEAVLDATWPGAVAPGATVKLVVSESTNAVSGEDLSEIYIIDNNLADVMTESFSVCEAGFGTQLSAFASNYSSLAEQAAAQGITYIVASGDGGPDSCDAPSTVPPTSLQPSVNLLASTAFTVAVGGTQFIDVASPSTYWNATNNATNFGSAKSYIPEKVWNESCTVAQCGASLAGLWSSGGGQSLVFPMPVWQSGVAGIPSGNRSVPDVSLTAADHDGYVLCLDASCQGTSASFSILSGTSASAQAFGGIMALVVQKTGARVGVANYTLYKLAASETFSSCNGSGTPALPATGPCVFNDTTVGDTNIPEVNPVETGFTATVGYDEATGLGSVNVSNLVNQWNTAVVNSTATTLVLNSGTAVTVTHGAPVPVSITVAPVAPVTGTPTGDVSLVASSLNGQGADFFPLMNGTASWNTIFLPGGTYPVHAHYDGDGTFLGSDSTPVTVTVNPEGSKTSLGVVLTNANGTTCSTTTSFTYGTPHIFLIAVVSDLNIVSTPCAPNETGSSPTGTVMLTDSFDGGAAAPLDGGSFALNSLGLFEDQRILLSAGTHNIQAAYLGDSSFSTSNTNAPTVTVAKAPTTATVTPGSASVAANTAFSLTVLVDTLTSSTPAAGSKGAAPTGTVTFTATTTGSIFPLERRGWPEPNQFIVGEVSAALACLFTLLFATRRRRGAVLLGMAMVIVIAVGTSCGSSATSTTNTITLGTATLSSAPDAQGFSAATATLSTAKLAATATVTATYGGDGNYNGSTSPVVTVTVH